MTWRPNKQITQEEFRAGLTAKGGVTRKQLEAWGVPYPPPKGWVKRLLGQNISYGRAKRGLSPSPPKSQADQPKPERPITPTAPQVDEIEALIDWHVEMAHNAHSRHMNAAMALQWALAKIKGEL